MITDDVRAKKQSFEKSSKHAAWLTLAGLLIVVASLVFSFYSLRKLNYEIAAKKNELIELDKRLQERKVELNVTERAFRDYERSVEKIAPQVAENALKLTSETNPQVKQVIEQAKRANSSNGSQPTKDLKTALEKEREGFQSLIAGDYDRSIVAFQASENAYSSFHNVYELARLLQRNKSQMIDPANRKEVFQTIVKKHAYGAPQDLWQQVVTIANE